MRYVRHRIDPRLATILGTLRGTPNAQALADRLADLAERSGPTPTGPDLVTALRGYQWLLDRVSDGGLPVTKAGYLRPVDVKAVAEVLPTMNDWIFPISLEVHARPVLGFRRFLQKCGLLRKHKGALVLTKAGTAARQDPTLLWRHLSGRLIPASPSFDEMATILILLHSATSPDERLNTEAIASTLQQLGWAHSTGQPVTASDVQWVANDVWDAIGNIGPAVGGRWPTDRTPSTAAVALVRDALLSERTPPGPAADGA
jgi:hypothetical protein